MYQGDVKIEAVPGLPSGLTPKARDGRNRLVLAEGEVTGHAHAIADSMAELYEDADGVLWLRAPQACTVEHEEHATITLAPGVYRIEQQVQWQGEPSRVLD